MKAKLLDGGAEKTFAVIFQTDDDLIPLLTEFAAQNRLGASHFTAIGAFKEATLGYFDWEKKDYRRIPVFNQVEVVSLIGDIALDQQGKPKIHAHAVLGHCNGTAMAGHLLEARVRPTLEVVLIESPVHLRRRFDPEAGLAVMNI